MRKWLIAALAAARAVAPHIVLPPAAATALAVAMEVGEALLAEPPQGVLPLGGGRS